MKVKCIENDGWNNFLTIGKFYEVIDEDIYCYKVINDRGIEDRLPKRWFKLLSEIRNETIDKLLSE